MTTENILFHLIRSVICGEAIDDKVVAACTPEMLDAVYTLARSHDVAHLSGYALDRLGLPDCEALHKGRNKMLQAVYRHARQEYELQQVCDLLEREGIPFIPLKGSVLRPYYPEPWMRTSCDTDILIHPEDLERTKNLLLDTLYFTERRTSAHDVGLVSPTNELVELHYAILEDFISPAAHEVLDHVWDYATPVEGSSYRYALPDEVFYYYHIIHMAKHVAHGGCSFRFFIDTWILNHQLPHDRAKRENMLMRSDHLTFAKAAERLADIWLGGEKMDRMSRYFADYIIRGGNFGNLTNRVAINQSREGGKVKYMLQRIILPYDLIKHYYPILQERKWLTPLYQLIRWWKLLTRGNVKHSLDEVRIATRYDNSEDIPTDLLIQHLGLHKH